MCRRGLGFIEQHARQPFFIDLAYNAAHWPYQPPDQPSTARDNARHLGPFDEPTSTRADYVAILERADQGIGRILGALDRLGVRQNTMVIVTNDDGGEWKLLLDGRRAMLFNLRTDIAERSNLIGQRPDVGRRLRALLAAWEADVDAEAKNATPR